MSRLLLAVVAFAAVGLGLLYAAGKAGYAGVVIVGAVQLLAIAAIARASTRA
jgi:hypothetical protein